MDVRKGAQVRVPNPEGDGTVAAILIVPGGTQGSAGAWVQYEDGPQAGLHAKVRSSDIEPA